MNVDMGHLLTSLRAIMDHDREILGSEDGGEFGLHDRDTFHEGLLLISVELRQSHRRLFRDDEDVPPASWLNVEECPPPITARDHPRGELAGQDPLEQGRPRHRIVRGGSDV